MIYRVKWLVVPRDLEGDRLEDLLNDMAARQFEFVSIEYFRDHSQAAVIFRHQ
jgi:hypothetical protein